MDFVIENFKLTGVALFPEDDDRGKMPVSLADPIVRILARLNEAITIQNLGFPETWLRMQAAYDLAQVEKHAGKITVRCDAGIIASA